MIVYGLTGGIGMGKSTAAHQLSELGLPVVDTDDLARAAVVPGSAGLAEVVACFGRAILKQDGSLDREALGALVFRDAQQRGELEAILHPRVRGAWQAQVAEWQGQGRKAGVVVIPLLFETSAERLVSKTICVACREQTQLKRLRERGWSDDEIAARVRAQWKVAQKMDSSDYVVWSEGAPEGTRLQLEKIVGQVAGNGGTA